MMTGAYTLISPPQTEPITLDEAKAHLRLEYDFSDDDDYITALIRAARQYTERHSSLLLISQTWKLSLDRFPDRSRMPIEIRRRPVSDVYAIEYIDEAGVKAVLPASKYKVDIDSYIARVTPIYEESWPVARCETNAVEVFFTAGFENSPEGVPAHLKQGMLLLIGHLYENREDSIAGLSIQSLPRGYDALVGIERVLGV